MAEKEDVPSITIDKHPENINMKISISQIIKLEVIFEGSMTNKSWVNENIGGVIKNFWPELLQVFSNKSNLNYPQYNIQIIASFNEYLGVIKGEADRLQANLVIKFNGSVQSPSKGIKYEVYLILYLMGGPSPEKNKIAIIYPENRLIFEE